MDAAALDAHADMTRTGGIEIEEMKATRVTRVYDRVRCAGRRR